MPAPTGTSLPAKIAASTGTIYYVDDEVGVDTLVGRDGTNPLLPWASIGYAIAQIPNPTTVAGGPRIHVAGDTTLGAQQQYDETLTYNRTGDATHVTTIEGIGTNKPKIKHVSSAGHVLQVSGAGDYVRFRKLDIEGRTQNISGGPVGIWTNGCSNVEFDQVDSHGFGVTTDHSTFRWSAWYLDGDHVQLWGCRGFDVCANGISQDNQSHAYYVPGDDIWLINCEGYDIGEGFGLQAYPSPTNVHIACSTFHDCSHSGVLVDRRVVGFSVRNTIVTNCGQYGIEGYDEGGTTGSDQTADHCITDDNTAGNTIVDGASPLVITNHLNNTDPLFVSEATPDLHLQAGSPAIDAGDAAYTPSTDIDGTTRVTSDIGAEAFTGGTVVVGLATETDSPLAVTALSGQVISVGLATEADSALAVAAASGQVVAVGLASEAESALPVTVPGVTDAGPYGIPLGSAPGGSTVAVGLATEADSALPVTAVTPGASIVPVGLALELDSAPRLKSGRRRSRRLLRKMGQ